MILLRDPSRASRERRHYAPLICIRVLCWMAFFFLFVSFSQISLRIGHCKVLYKKRCGLYGSGFSMLRNFDFCKEATLNLGGSFLSSQAHCILLGLIGLS